MHNDIPNTYTSKKVVKPFWQSPKNWGQLTERLPNIHNTVTVYKTFVSDKLINSLFHF